MGKGRAAGRKLQVFYSEELGAEICAELAAGCSMRSICAKPGRPHAGTVRNWEMRHPEFEMAVLAAPPRNAREAQAWIEATGAPYADGIGPNGQMRPPMIPLFDD